MIMDNNDFRFIFESSQTRLERIIRRLWILCIIMLLTLIISNACWIYYENQWQYVETTTQDVVQDGSGTNIVGSGDINYGTTNEAVVKNI